jgi:hypothetical protein
MLARFVNGARFARVPLRVFAQLRRFSAAFASNVPEKASEIIHIVTL